MHPIGQGEMGSVTCSTFLVLLCGMDTWTQATAKTPKCILNVDPSQNAAYSLEKPRDWFRMDAKQHCSLEFFSPSWNNMTTPGSRRATNVCVTWGKHGFPPPPLQPWWWQTQGHEVMVVRKFKVVYGDLLPIWGGKEDGGGIIASVSLRLIGSKNGQSCWIPPFTPPPSFSQG